jgi:hypothetical protein
MRSSFSLGRPFLFFALAVAWLMHGQAARAQTSTTDVDRARLLTTQPTPPPEQAASANGVNQDYAAASPNDPDLGVQQILKRVEKYEPFTFDIGAPFYFTTNVALADRGEQGDVLVAPGIGITWAPKITRTFYGEVAMRQQFFFYGRFKDLNFASFNTSAGVSYYVPKLQNLSLHARYNYNRLTDTDQFDEFFVNHSIELSAEVPIRFGRSQQVTIGAVAEFSLYAHPEPPRRNDYQVFVGYALNVSRSFSLDAVARLALRDYFEGGRLDVSETLSLSANYRVREFLTLSALTTFSANQSNKSGFDYEVFNIGGAIQFAWKF